MMDVYMMDHVYDAHEYALGTWMTHIYIYMYILSPRTL